ncbi:hypothetical protein [Peribacillus huizhouensis]
MCKLGVFVIDQGEDQYDLSIKH